MHKSTPIHITVSSVVAHRRHGRPPVRSRRFVARGGRGRRLVDPGGHRQRWWEWDTPGGSALDAPRTPRAAQWPGPATWPSVVHVVGRDEPEGAVPVRSATRRLSRWQTLWQVT